LDRLGTVAIVGVGLIGGSIGLALRELGLAERVMGIGRREANLAEAVRVGAIDAATTDLASGVAEADVVVVCTPVTEIAAAVRIAAGGGPEGILVTDAGSTKLRIVEAVERDPAAARVFVGSHPIAGSERKGVTHARPDLFEGKSCVLTPTARTPHDRLQRARSFWGDLGCRVIELGPAEHDDVLALTSHLPHAVAAALAATVPAEALPMAAGAYRDGTRVAGSDTTLWAGIFRENKGPTLRALAQFQDQIGAFRRAMEADDVGWIRDWWDSARGRRSLFDAQHRPAVPED
jgi:prephenate dehydrogenase